MRIHNKSSKNTLSIRLTESAVFLRTDGIPNRRTGVVNDTRSAMLRGLLVLDLVKPTKIASIEVELTATTSAAWPDGIGARRIEVTEDHQVFRASTTYFHAGKANAARRAASIGPGVSYAHTQVDADGYFGDDSEDGEAEGSWDDILLGHGHPSDVMDAPGSPGVSRSNSEAGPHSSASARMQERMASHYQPLHLRLSGSSSTQRLPSSSFNPIPPPLRTQRRVSMDSNQFQRMPLHETYHEEEEFAPIPPYSPFPPLSPASTREGGSSGSTIGGQASPSGSSANLESGPSSAGAGMSAAAQTLEEFRNSLRTNFLDRHPSSQTSSALSLHSIQQDQSASRRQSFADIIQEDEGSSAVSPIPRPSLPVAGPSNTNTNPTPRPRSPPHPAPLPYRNSRSQSPSQSHRSTDGPSSGPSSQGRKASRFSFSAVSNILNAVRSTSPLTNRHERVRGRERSVDRSLHGNERRGRTMDRGFANGSALEMEEEEERGRGRGVIGRILKDKDDKGEGWKEFKKGTYTYPISFSIPGNSPPSMQCDFGSVCWRLKASVHRPGTFKTKMTAVRDVVIIACPTEDDTEDTENIIVERHWDNQLQYLISVSGRSFYIGGMVPVTFTLMPLTKVKIHRISVFIEERVDYYTNMRRIARSDPPTRFSLLSLRNEGKGADPILPLESDDVEVLRNSPLFQVVNPDDDLGEMASNLMGPGPWTFHRDLKLPGSCDLLKFTNRNKRANILVTHLLKLVMRVERGDDVHVDKTGKRKLFDIVVQTPVLILSCRCNPEWTSLPRYAEEFDDLTTFVPSCPCQAARQHEDHTSGFRSTLDRIASRHSTDSSASAAETSPVHPSMNSLRHMSFNESILRTNSLFERLVSGQESETGESPPAYDVASTRPHISVPQSSVAVL